MSEFSAESTSKLGKAVWDQGAEAELIWGPDDKGQHSDSVNSSHP